MKAERQSRLHDELTTKKHVADIDETKNQITPVELDSSDGASSIHICSRTRPFSNKQHHRYVRREETKTLSNPLASYNCRCLCGYSSCRLCMKQSPPIRDFSKNLAEKCDRSYHPVLSNKNGKILIF